MPEHVLDITKFMSMDGTVLDVPSMDIVPSHYQHCLQQFISKVHTAISNYVLHITFLFRGCNLHVIGLYYPPNDIDVQQQIHRYIKHTIHNLKQDVLDRVVILYDSNSITNRFLDRTGSSRFYKKQSN